MKKENSSNKFNFLRIPITILLLIVFVNNFNNSPIIASEKIIVVPKIEVKEIVKLTPVNVWKKIIEYEIEQPKIVFSQVMLETGQLKSEGAIIDNNLFGFYKQGAHRVFESWEESVIFYKEWQDKRYVGGNYYKFLKKIGYAKDSMYISKLMNIQTKLFKNSEYGME